MGLSGAFTAIADDATAASWNPAGLIQLQRAEVSVVLRYAREKDRHHSSDRNVTVSENEFDHANVNYFSAVYPFYAEWLKKNMVISLNVQEAYDFTQSFSSDVIEKSSDQDRVSSSAAFRGIQTDIVQDANATTMRNLVFVSDLETKTITTFQQLLSSDLITSLAFEQQGGIDAITPAWAIKITPALSFGTAINLYQDRPGESIRSRTIATYAGNSDSDVGIISSKTTSGTYAFNGTVTFTIPGFPPVTTNISGEGTYDPFSNVDTS